VSSAPDFAEPIFGWRVWETTEVGGARQLSSLYHPVLWPAGEPLTAVCLRAWANCRLMRLLKRKPHQSPAPGCECGIYAVPSDRARPALDGITDRLRNPVLGRVALWGEVHEHEYGWRAQHGYPQRLYVAATPGNRSKAILQAEELRHYRVPVEVLGDTSAFDDLLDELMTLAAT
jgi:hypothetical protein